MAIARFKPTSVPALIETHGMTREEWFELAVEGLRPHFEAINREVPPLKISCSWPGGGSPRKRMGECWACSQSAAGINEIYISPVLSDPVQVLEVLLHEMIHAVDDCKHGHRAPFARMARELGLEGKITATYAGGWLRNMLTGLSLILGPYPHKSMTLKRQKVAKKSTVKITCDDCAFVFRTSVKAVVEIQQAYLTRMDEAGDEPEDGNIGMFCPVCQCSALVCQ